jgi:DNA-directed RNA polymerase subunit RPC12/RpoP
MKLIQCNKCGRHFRVLDNSYELQKCTGCGSSDLYETIYTLSESTLNWEQIRADAAIAAIPAAIKMVNYHTKPHHISNKTVTANCIAMECVNIADAIIAELKKR